MERFSRILIIIFVLTLVNLGLNSYLINKINKIENIAAKNTIANTTVANTSLTKATTKPIASNEPTISDDLATIKAEIRSLREILGTTKTFEDLNILIKTIENNE